MKLSDFDYSLPEELIAQYPLKERDEARLMVIDRQMGTITHSVFNQITQFLRTGDLLVLNDTRVIPARIYGKRLTGGKLEVLLLRLIQKTEEGFVFEALLKPGRLKLNETVVLAEGKLQAKITGKEELTIFAESLKQIYTFGVMPLPPYIKRMAVKEDNIYYQTIYARADGSVAAPTAGLHFTDKLIENIKAKGMNLGYVTLHVGHATFKPVKIDDITLHQMGYEYYNIPQDTSQELERARQLKSRVIAVGTTSLRTLEAYASSGIKENETDLFIYPGYEFKITDCLLTNFHLPKTTLFMLVCAFGAYKGKEYLIRKAYFEAIDKKYRFYSYGDAMLII